MNFACSTDDYYAAHCGTMLESLLGNAPTPSVMRIHILHGGSLSIDNQERFRSLVAKHGAGLQFIEIAADQIAAFPQEKFHASCWYRVLLPELLPELLRIIYLDADMLVLDDLTSLWELELDQRPFAAIVNPLYPFMPDRPRDTLGLDGPSEYLNSGVLVMDLSRCREIELSSKVRSYAAHHPDNIWPEQDALSAVFRGAWLALPPRWNAQTTLFDLTPARLPFTAEEIDEARKNPAIVHFIGPLKPWHYLCRHPLGPRYAEFRKRTPWPELELEGKTIGNRLLRPLSLANQVRIRRTLRRMRSLRAALRS